MIEVDDNREFVKIRYDGSKITQAQNSQKIPRFARCKKENLHGGNCSINSS